MALIIVLSHQNIVTKMDRLLPLNLPKIQGLRIRNDPRGQGLQVWDSLRGKWLVLTPEEWVRRHFIDFLVTRLSVEPTSIAQEVRLGELGRADIVVYGSSREPRMVVECKAPDVPLTQETLQQVGRYNSVLEVRFVAVTNGIEHYYFEIDHIKGEAIRVNCPSQIK